MHIGVATPGGDSTEQAIEAGSLMAVGGIGCDPSLAVSGGGSLGITTDGKVMVLAAADLETAAEGIVATCTRAGLKVMTLGATDALVIQEAAAEAVRGGGVVIQLEFERGAMAIATDGRLGLARQISLGIDDLVDAICKPIHTGEGRKWDPLTPREAEEILLGNGLPQRLQEVAARPGMTGAALWPVLQPVLQRLLIEIRQTLRFCGQGRPTVRLTGLGARIKGLREVLSEGLDAEISCVEHADSHDCKQAAGPDLMPASVIDCRIARQARWALVAGTVVAVAGLATDASLHIRYAMEIQRDSQALGEEQASSAPKAEENLKNAALAARVHELRFIKKAGTQGQCDWGAVLRLLGSIQCETVKITSVAASACAPGNSDGIGGILTLEGYASSGAGDDGISGESLTGYLSSLSSTALVAGVTLGEVQRSSVSGQSVERFQATVKLWAAEDSATSRRAEAEESNDGK